MAAPDPQRLLIVRPDTYGDLVLFEPALRALRETWPDTRLTILIREPYRDIVDLLPAGIEWLTTRCNPYREGMSNAAAELALLQTRVETVDPDCVVAACYNKTWLETLVASWAPAARRISLGPPQPDAISAILLERETGRPSDAWFPEVLDVDAESHECTKNLRLAAYLLGEPTRTMQPQLQIPAAAREDAERWLVAQGLKANAFLVCCPAGGANVTIKAWPTERYASVLTTAAGEMGIEAALAAHESEGQVLAHVADLVERQTGRRPPLWLGRDGGFAETAALVASARAYIGNDTGLAHVAGAVDRPAIVVYGGGTWPRFLPAGRRSVAVVLPLACFGCGWHCLFDEPLCLTRLSEAAVVRGLRMLLGTEPIEGCAVLTAPPPTEKDQARIASAVEAAGTPARAVRAVRTHTLEVSRRDIERLLDQLRVAEQDRAARLEVIERQGRELGRVPTLEADVAFLKQQVAAIEAERAAGEAEISRHQSAVAESQAVAAGLRARIDLARRSRAYRLLRRFGLLEMLDDGSAPAEGPRGQ